MFKFKAKCSIYDICISQNNNTILASFANDGWCLWKKDFSEKTRYSMVQHFTEHGVDCKCEIVNWGVWQCEIIDDAIYLQINEGNNYSLRKIEI